MWIGIFVVALVIVGGIYMCYQIDNDFGGDDTDIIPLDMADHGGEIHLTKLGEDAPIHIGDVVYAGKTIMDGEKSWYAHKPNGTEKQFNNKYDAAEWLRPRN